MSLNRSSRPSLDPRLPWGPQLEQLVAKKKRGGKKALDLRKQKLSALPVDDLVKALALTPPQVSAVWLDSNDLASTRNAEELGRILKAIPSSTVTRLRLTGNALGKLQKKDQLAEVFKALPRNLGSLNLTENDLSALPADELIVAFSALPPINLRSLYLSKNGLNKLSAEDLIRVLSAIPGSVKWLYFSDNNLGQYTGAELARIFKALSDREIHVALSQNKLGKKSAQELATAFTAMHSQPYLDLSSNDLGSCDKLAVFLAAIPPCVEYLWLDGNNLGLQSRGALAKALAKLPANITELSLENNLLDKLPAAELAAALAAVPSSVNVIKLGKNNITAAQTVEMLSKLPFATKAKLQDIKLNYTSIDKTHDQLLLLTQQYFASNLSRDPKNPKHHPEKVEFFRDLIKELEKAKKAEDKYEAMKAFVALFKGKDKVFNQHRDPEYKRYLINVLCVLTILPALCRAVQSCLKFGTPCFWQPDSEKLKGAALKHGETMRIAPPSAAG